MYSKSALLESQLEKPSGSAGWVASYSSFRTAHGEGLRLTGNPDQVLPATAEDTSCKVIFDGVLYNRALLGKYFRRSGTDNDAALVLQAYRHWGEDLIRKIKGIFALLIQDRERDVLLGARDPVGVYPLFYENSNGEWLFSTSIEALTRHPRVSAEINRAAIADDLCHRWSDVEETFFKNIKRVAPGHVIHIGRTKEVRRYWKLPIPGAGADWVREDELQHFDRLLDQAVQRCLSVGPAGIYLSGGLDSVSVAAVAAENSRRRSLPTPWALSLGFPDECSEEQIQKSVAKDLGLPQLFVPLEDAAGREGLLLAALRITSERPVPLQCPWHPAYHRLASEGKQRGCKVILTGGGGDEWLGVSPLLAADLMRNLDLGGLYRLWSAVQSSYPLPWHRNAKNMLWKFGARPLMSAAVREILHHVAPALLRARHGRRMRQATPNWVAPDPLLKQEIDRRLEKRLTSTKPIRQTGGFYFSDLWESLDHPLTAMEMEELFETGARIGLRILMPYWDADLLEMLYRIPPHLLNKGGRSKGLVRHSVAQRFPQLGFEQQKKIISTNFFNSTMLREGKIAWKVLGGTQALGELGIVDERRLGSTIEKILAENQSREAYRIWEVLNLEAWLRPRV
jgi:asparagine synthase (glutamine-hydrolysing)